jgi:hypothetical protein
MTRRAIQGWEDEHVVAVDAAIARGEWPSGTVIVVDDEGRHAGVGVADAAAAAGAQVEIVTRKAMAGDQLAFSAMTPYVLTRWRARAFIPAPSRSSRRSLTAP